MESQHRPRRYALIDSSSRHHLRRRDLSALASGNITADITTQLRAAELSKNTLLFETSRRLLLRNPGSRDSARVIDATRLLQEVQASHPASVTELLASPQFGAWAAACLFTLRSTSAELNAKDRFLLSHDYGHVATFAAVAAIRSGYPFEIHVPARHGLITFPTLGIFDTRNAALPYDWVKVQMTGDHTIVFSPSGSNDLRIDLTTLTHTSTSRWTPIARVDVGTHGHQLRLMIDFQDPFLGERYGIPVARLSNACLERWHERLEGAWEILVKEHPPIANALTIVLSTLVPLAAPNVRIPVSASSGWAWGSVALSLPSDSQSLAEILVHELHHHVLGAVEDLVPLCSGSDDRLYYAPWRDDLRPLRELLQGIYAHLGVTAFWQRQLHAHNPGGSLHAEVEFARWRRATLQSAETACRSEGLSDPGLAFFSAVRNRLEEWQAEQLSHESEKAAAEIAIEHYARWRLNHLSPDPTMIEELAQAWIGGRRAPTLSHIRTTVVSTTAALPTNRHDTLEIRHRDPALFQRLLEARRKLRAADVALLRGDNDRAAQGYLRRIRSAKDLDAWVGFIVSRYKEAADETVESVLEHPEIIVALYTRIRELGTTPSPDTLIRWLHDAAG